METAAFRLDNDPVATREINWDDLDKKAFLVYGGVLFTGATAALYPLSTLKTHLQVDSATVARAAHSRPAGEQVPRRPTIVHAFRGVVANYGFRGLYRGFGTVALGAIPGRGVYLTTLEFVRYNLIAIWGGRDNDANPAVVAARASFIAGGAASMATQLVVVPVDVVSQRQMVAKSTASQSAIDVVRCIVRDDGLRGLYRGLGPSIATFVPSSAMWWSGYAAYQRIVWSAVLAAREGAGSHSTTEDNTTSPPGETMAVQAASAILAGLTSSLVTTPLDVVKTRVQVGRGSVRQVIRKLVETDGLRGFYKGIGPRMFNVSIWGTTMVTTYEYLKRIARRVD